MAARATLGVLNTDGGFTVINWPTAFVIAVAMICGAVLINKPSDAAFGGDGGMIVGSSADGAWYIAHLKDGKVRICYAAFLEKGPPTCGAWAD